MTLAQAVDNNALLFTVHDSEGETVASAATRWVSEPYVGHVWHRCEFIAPRNHSSLYDITGDVKVDVRTKDRQIFC